MKIKSYQQKSTKRSKNFGCYARSIIGSKLTAVINHHWHKRHVLLFPQTSTKGKSTKLSCSPPSYPSAQPMLQRYVYIHAPILQLKIIARKLSYRKDDRAMRPIYGCPEIFRESLSTPTAILIPKFLMGFCSDRSYECAYKI